MNYRTLEKIKIFSGLTAMAIIVMAWLYPVFFLLINANKTASDYAKGSKTEIIWGTSIFNNFSAVFLSNLSLISLAGFPA